MYRGHFELQIDMIRTAPGHILISMPNLKSKERILKASREKCQLTYKNKYI
jgi:hypothetical protein